MEGRSPEGVIAGRCESHDVVLGTKQQSSAKIASDLDYSIIFPAPKDGTKVSKERS